MRRFRRKAVSSIIGGIIVLTIFLTALTAMVVVSQQYDSYQSIVNKMSQKDIDRSAESLVPNYPGLKTSNTISCSGSSSGKCNEYWVYLSNVGWISNAGATSGVSGGGGGGVGIQIVRIFINSTTASSGCAVPSPPSPTPGGPCVLAPASTATAYGFRTADAFLNPGEFNHTMTVWLPDSIQLPNPSPPAPQNTIWIVTARGRVFSFEWPFPPTEQALEAINANVATGTMRIAYTGNYNSKNEPAWGGAGGSGYCHTESTISSDAISAGSYGTLYFVNPWITDTILGDATFGSPPGTLLYIYAKFTNTKTTPVTITTGSLLIQVTAASANQKVYFIGGQYIGGVAGSGAFVGAPTALTVSASQSSTIIFKVVQWNVGTQKNPTGAVTLSFSGMAAISNTATDSTYFGASLLLEGFYDRTSCTQP